MDIKLLLQIAGVLLGLLYLWLEYRADIRLWIVGLVMPLIHGALYYKSGLYADCSMQAYYVLAGLYGWLVWRRRGRKTDAGLTGPEDAEGAKRAAALRIGHTPLRTVPALAGVYAAAHIGLYLLLTRFTDSTVPFWDAGTTALSVVAMWMLSRKLVEQWLVWLVVDLVTVGLYLYKDLPYTAGLYALYSALADTVNQNPVLKKAGVVDAGGKGWVVALEAMLSALQGEDVVLPENGAVTQTKQSADFSDFNTEDITFSYCTEFIISRENDHDPENLRAFLSELGDSLVLVDDDEIIKVHVHTNDPGKALTEALNYGSFVTVKIENMRLQHTEKVLSEQEVAPKIAKPEKPLGVVSVCAGAGLADVFQNLGVDQIISGGQTMNPSTQDILEAVNKVPAETVFVLPNNKNIIMAAQQVDALTPKTVVVIPSKTVPQGITAMLSFAPEGSVEENTAALTEALDTVDTMQITYAARNSDFDGYDIHEGDYLALYGSQLFGTSQDIRVLLKSLAEKVRDDGKEYITIYYGEDVKEKHAQKAADIFADICPNADVNLLSGGQPVYYYLISAE